MSETIPGKVSEIFAESLMTYAISETNNVIFSKTKAYINQSQETANSTGAEIRSELLQSGLCETVKEVFLAIEKTYTDPVKKMTSQYIGHTIDKLILENRDGKKPAMNACVAAACIGSVTKDDHAILANIAQKNPQANEYLTQSHFAGALEAFQDGVDNYLLKHQITSIREQNIEQEQICSAYFQSTGSLQFLQQLGQNDTIQFVKDYYDHNAVENRMNQYQEISTSLSTGSEESLQNSIKYCIEHLFDTTKDTIKEVSQKVPQTFLRSTPKTFIKLIKTGLFTQGVAYAIDKTMEPIGQKLRLNVEHLSAHDYIYMYCAYDRLHKFYKNLGKKEFPSRPEAQTNSFKEKSKLRLQYINKCIPIHLWNASISMIKLPANTFEKVTMNTAKKLCERNLKIHHLPMIDYAEEYSTDTYVKTQTDAFHTEKRKITEKELALVQYTNSDLDALLKTLPSEVIQIKQMAQAYITNNQIKSPIRKMAVYLNTVKESKERLAKGLTNSIFTRNPWVNRMNHKVVDMFTGSPDISYYFSSLDDCMHVKMNENLYINVTKNGFDFVDANNAPANLQDITDNEKVYIQELLSYEYEIGTELGNPTLQHHHEKEMDTLERENIWERECLAIMKHHPHYQFELVPQQKDRVACIRIFHKDEEQLNLPAKILLSDQTKKAPQKTDIHLRSIDTLLTAMEKNYLQASDQYFGRPNERSIQIAGAHAIRIEREKGPSYLLDLAHKKVHLNPGLAEEKTYSLNLFTPMAPSVKDLHEGMSHTSISREDELEH